MSNAHLAAKRAHILGVLRDLHLLDGLAERRAIAGAVLAHHADLLRAFRLKLRVKLSGYQANVADFDEFD